MDSGEHKPTISKETKLSELTAHQFAGVMLGLLNHHDIERAAAGGSVGELSVDQFKMLMEQLTESKLHKLANAEQEVTKRIFKDSESLANSGTSFRLRNASELQRFYDTWMNFFQTTPDGQLIVVMSITDSQTGVARRIG